MWSEIGRALDWSQPTTSAIKNAKRPIDLEELPGLAVVLHVRLCWLAFEEGPMKGVGDAAPAGRAPGDREDAYPFRVTRHASDLPTSSPAFVSTSHTVRFR